MNKFKITKGYNLQLKGSPNNILDLFKAIGVKNIEKIKYKNVTIIEIKKNRLIN